MQKRAHTDKHTRTENGCAVRGEEQGDGQGQGQSIEAHEQDLRIGTERDIIV
jgi:hypothetical protein